MAPIPSVGLLGVERWEEGWRFVEAIQSLGFFPNIACWVQDRISQEFRIALVTPLVDRIGARPLYMVLEKAYQAAAITIDPLEIELFSPASRFNVEFLKQVATWDKNKDSHLFLARERKEIVDGVPITFLDTESVIIVDDTVVAPSWGYKVQRVVNSRRIGSLDKEFQSFADHVRKLAA